MTVFLKACINGARRAEQHPALPISAETIARDAQAVVAAGANAVHFHIRNQAGFESLAPDDAARCITACRRAVPDTPLGVSTGDWIVPDLDERLRLLSQWRVMPDFASVNFHEDGAEEVARVLHERGVGIELGLTFPFAAERALFGGWVDRCERVLLEPIETDTAAALVTVAEIERILDRAQTSAPRLLHGHEDTAWLLLDESARWGYQCRIGFEDTLYLPTGELAVDNAHIVKTAQALLAEGEW